jgi:hypothetical protein
MPYKALTYLNLPGDPEVRKSPGDKITDKEFKDAGQDAEQIAALIESGAISDDMKADLHPDYTAPEDITAPEGSDEHVVAGDEGGASDANN